MFNFILPSFIFKIEKWKWNKEYKVYVSNFGNFKDNYKNNIPVKINSSGYCTIKTAYGTKLAHRLVMLTWKPIPNAESLTVDHLNHNKRDNSLLNLEWVSKEENQTRAADDYLPAIEKKAKIADACPVYITLKNGEDMKFKTWESCLNYCFNTCHIEKTTDKEKIKGRVRAAAANGKPYCGVIWKMKTEQ